MNRIAVYTCVTGSYDKLNGLSTKVPWADFVFFGEIGTACEGWDVRPINWVDKVPGGDNIALSRYAKLNPHVVLPEYEYSLWIDGNVDICQEALYERLAKMMDEGVLYGGLSHPERDDVYDESLRIVRNARESLPKVMRVIRFLKSEGMPRHFGLNENNVILRRHNEPSVIAFDVLWWEMFMRFSHRDQLTWSYCMWKTGLKQELILPQGKCARNSSEFGYTLHGRQYVKDRSLRGRLRDALTAAKVSVYRLFLSTIIR